MSFMTRTYAKAVGFTAITEDELYYVNGGYNTNPSTQNRNDGGKGFTSFSIDTPVGNVTYTIYDDGTMSLSGSVGIDLGPVEVNRGFEFPVPNGTSYEELKKMGEDAIKDIQQDILQDIQNGNVPIGSAQGGPTAGNSSNHGYTGKYGDCGL